MQDSPFSMSWHHAAAAPPDRQTFLPAAKTEFTERTIHNCAPPLMPNVSRLLKFARRNHFS
jgi:hypothetical protein